MVAMSQAVLEEIQALGLKLRCPRCMSSISGRECSGCAFRIAQEHGIWNALPPEREAYFARFISEYEQIRAAEGRGSESSQFYLELPYRDTTGRNQAQWDIRARSYDYLLRNILTPRAGNRGTRVLDIGAGNGWMSFRLAKAGYEPVAVDLLMNAKDGLQAADHYRAHLERLFPRFRAEMSRLPFEEDQFDAALFNASFHYAEDFTAAAREALRCIRPRGLLIIFDTPWYAQEASGQKMIAERRVLFLKRYGTTSSSIQSGEYLTDQRLKALEQALAIHWTVHRPYYGLRWAMRPVLAKLRQRREPSRFRIYVAEKNA